MDGFQCIGTLILSREKWVTIKVVECTPCNVFIKRFVVCFDTSCNFELRTVISFIRLRVKEIYQSTRLILTYMEIALHLIGI